MIPRKGLVPPPKPVRDASLFIIVVEGANTERSYFHELEAGDLIPRTRVKPHVVPPEDNKSGPQHLLNNAEKAKEKYRPRLGEDEIWIVFDVDIHSGSNRIEQIHSVLHEIESQKWFAALSNPCFEVWLLLHVTDNVSGIDDFGASAEKKLRALLGSYSKSNVPALCLERDAIKDAIGRAKTLDTDPNSPIPQLPGTRVYRLVERLVGARIA